MDTENVRYLRTSILYFEVLAEYMKIGKTEELCGCTEVFLHRS